MPLGGLPYMPELSGTRGNAPCRVGGMTMKTGAWGKDGGGAWLGAGLGESVLLTFGFGGATELTRCQHR